MNMRAKVTSSTPGRQLLRETLLGIAQLSRDGDQVG